MDLSTFAIENGFVEAKLRGYRSSFLKEEHYNQLKGFNTLEEVFQYLQSETDYGDYIDINNVSIVSLKNTMKKKLSDELDFIEINCMQSLSDFLFYIRAGYMIDNVMNILEGLKSGTDFKRLLASIDPIGYFPELAAIEIAENDLSMLYETVIIDTPLSRFFGNYLEYHTSELKNFNEVEKFFKEEKPEKVRSSLKKIWLEEFVDFCENLNDISARNMNEILMREADFKTLQITYNSLEDNKDERVKVRKELCPSVGYLYPMYYQHLKEAENLETMKDVVKGFLDYKVVLSEIPEPNRLDEGYGKTLEDAMYEEEVRQLTYVFDEQANLAAFYAYVKLKEQEIRNIIWYCEMISRKLDKGDPNWKKIIIPFSVEF